jgi:hypothetical protein
MQVIDLHGCVSKDESGPDRAATCFETHHSATVLVEILCPSRAAMLLSMRPREAV